MRQVNVGFRNRLETGFSTLVRLWQIDIRCKGSLYFTDNTRDIFFGGKLWKAAPGITISAIRQTVADGFSDAEVKFPLSDDGISEAAVRYNELNGAAFSIVAVHFDALELGSMFMFAGKLSDATIEGDLATISALGTVKNTADLVIGEVYSERCRNVIYDSKCKVDKKKYRVKIEVIGINPDGTFKTTYTFPTEEDDLGPDENTEVIESLNETIFKPPPGNGEGVVPFQYVVPDDVDEIRVKAKGAGGGGSIFFVRLNKSSEVILGPNGSDTTFLGMKGFGGGHGGFEPNEASMRPDPYFFTYLATVQSYNGGAEGGDENITFPQPTKANIYGPISNHEQYLTYPNHGRWSVGGSGGQATKTYKVGPGEELEAGQVIDFTVGKGGYLIHPVFSRSDPYLTGDDGSVTIVTVKRDTIITTIEQAAPELDFDYGVIDWTTGDNACRTTLISSIKDGNVAVLVNSARPIKVGDVGFYVPGCTNYRSYCVGKFDNLINFRAEPDVPNITAPVESPVKDDAPTTGLPPGAIID